MNKPLTLSSVSSSAYKEQSGSRPRKYQLRKKMERNGISPGERVIRNIMNYSRALSVLKTSETGFVNFVMN